MRKISGIRFGNTTYKQMKYENMTGIKFNYVHGFEARYLEDNIN